MKHVKKRRALIDAALRMERLGLTQGTAGNVSVRISSGLLITPSGIAYDKLALEDIVAMGPDGTVEPGQRKPSSEWRFHTAILATRPEAKAVVHCHSMFATTLACLRRDIPAFHYMIAVAGGDSIRCAEYATFGSKDLADNALKALEGRHACLLANHGMIAFGPDLEGALALALEVETLAAQYWRALQVGDPVILPPKEMAVVLEKFRDYGKQS